MALPDSGQAGAEIEITPAMIEAGVMVLIEQDVDCAVSSVPRRLEELVVSVFDAMTRKKREVRL